MNHHEVTERLLTIATADKGDAQTLTDTVLTDLIQAGRAPSHVLVQEMD